jgi:hypothetical protein
MTAIDHTQPPARVVYDLDNRRRPQCPGTDLRAALPRGLPVTRGQAQGAGYTVGDQVQRIEDINAAIERMLAGQGRHSLDDVDLMTTDPEDIAERVRRAGIDRSAHLEMVNQRNGIQRKPTQAAAEQVRANGDAIVRAMRKRLDPAVTIVPAAADRGLTQHTDTAALLNTGSPEEIAAYRSLEPPRLQWRLGSAGASSGRPAIAR